VPHVAPDEGLNQAIIDLVDLRETHGPPPWRVPVIGTPNVRFVYLAWEPGFATVPHVHPRADETFHVLIGRAVFRFGDRPGEGAEIEAGPGSLLWSPAGRWHDIRVTGDEDFYMLIAVSPNEDAPDETVESPVSAGVPA
jgi:mannose-6-phosphate isomerase-like protein (cupin superfamily)